MSGMASAPSELPYAAQLVEPVADILVSMASHSVTWAVEQLILHQVRRDALGNS